MYILYRQYNHNNILYIHILYDVIDHVQSVVSLQWISDRHHVAAGCVIISWITGMFYKYTIQFHNAVSL